MTGSFVIAGAELVTHDYGVVGKLLAIVAFVVAVGFLVGVGSGAVAWAASDVSGALIAVAIVIALALWALYREKQTAMSSRARG